MSPLVSNGISSDASKQALFISDSASKSIGSTYQGAFGKCVVPQRLHQGPGLISVAALLLHATQLVATVHPTHGPLRLFQAEGANCYFPPNRLSRSALFEPRPPGQKIHVTSRLLGINENAVSEMLKIPYKKTVLFFDGWSDQGTNW